MYKIIDSPKKFIENDSKVIFCAKIPYNRIAMQFCDHNIIKKERYK